MEIHRYLHVLCATTVISTAIVGGQEPPNRAKLPDWQQVPPGIFFDDAFREGLRGERPQRLDANPTETAAGGSQLTASTAVRWSQLVSAATIEDEIKRIQRRMDAGLRNEGFFKSQGCRELRVHFGTAAVLFAIIGEFDATVRWQADAVQCRNQFARLALNAKVASSAVFREAQQRHQELSDLVRGARLTPNPSPESLAWPEFADRQLIMQRLEIVVDTSLSQGLATAGTEKSSDALVSQCELADAITEALLQDDMADAEDTEYIELCRRMRQATRELKDSLQRRDTGAARRALGEVKKSCVDCHDLYRA